MLILHNVKMVPSNVRKKKELLNMTKVQSYVKLVPLNVRKKNKGTTECDKSTVTCDVDTAQCDDDIIKYEKKEKENY